MCYNSRKKKLPKLHKAVSTIRKQTGTTYQMETTSIGPTTRRNRSHIVPLSQRSNIWTLWKEKSVRQDSTKLLLVSNVQRNRRKYRFLLSLSNKSISKEKQ